MKGICCLYDTLSDLRKSHITPKFAYDYFKATGSKYIRNATNPNKRLQDGIKRYFLSERAELEFSKREKWFAETIFKGYMEKNQKVFTYNENLYYFAVSHMWRVLLLHLHSGTLKGLDFETELYEVADEWKLFLREYKYPLKYNRFYMLFTDRVRDHNLGIPGVDYYLSRAIDITVITNAEKTDISVYGKFLRFVFWGIIKGGEDKISDLKIDPIGGQIGFPQKSIDSEMMGFFINRIRETESQPKASEGQQDIIVEQLRKDNFIHSDGGKSMYNDIYNLDPK